MPGKYQVGKGPDAERELNAYLKALGHLLVPAANYAQNGAPMIEASDRRSSLIMPDTLAIKSGHSAWFESKWKTQAVPRHTHGCYRADCAAGRPGCGGRKYTGIDRINYEHYRRVQDVSGAPVVLVFLHELEDEVRCGTIATLDEAQAPHATAAQHGKGGMHNWWYDAIPYWMKYSEMKLAVGEFFSTGRARDPGARMPIAGALRPPRPEVQVPMFGPAWGVR